MTSPSPAQIRQAYRDIYKHALRAVQYSKPARFVVQDRVRNAFRTSPPEEFDAIKISRTLEFLDHAAKVRGLEHRVLKNLMFVWWEQKKLPYIKARDKDLPFRIRAYDDFNRTIEKLNESMGMCIK